MSGFTKRAGTVGILLVQFLALQASIQTDNTTGGIPCGSHPAQSPKPRAQPKAKLIRGPYLQMVNEEGATLRWRTDIPTNSK